MMDKFTKYKKTSDQITDDEDIRYNDDYIKIIGTGDDMIIDSKDTVAILPYFFDESFVLLQHKTNPNYVYKLKNSHDYKDIKEFVGVIREPIEKEPILTVKQCMTRNGIILSDLYKIEPLAVFFKNEHQTSRYFLYLLELYTNDYRMIKNNESNIIRVDLGSIDDLRIVDLVTYYLIEELNKSIKK